MEEQFLTSLASIRPEGMEDEAWTKLQDAVVSAHNKDIQGLKITNAQLKEEKTAEITKYKDLEASYTKQAEEMKALNSKLEANQPEELKKFYENQQLQAANVFNKKEEDYKAKLDANAQLINSLQTQVLRGDVLAEFNKAASNVNWLGGGREMAQQMVCGKDGSNFGRVNLGDGNTVLANDNKEDVEAALKAFLDTEVGKHLVSTGNSGSGAGGTNTNNPGGPKTLTMAQFQAMSPGEQMKAVTEDGYTIV